LNINAIVVHDISIASFFAGTTTESVKKFVKFFGIGSISIPAKIPVNYLLYKNKHSVNSAENNLKNLDKELKTINHTIDYQSRSNSEHYLKRYVL